MSNHVIDNCFKKYDYPPHWQQIVIMVNNCASNGGHEDDFQSKAAKMLN
jgi:hypothetical protein